MSSGQGDPEEVPSSAAVFFDAVAGFYDRVYAIEGADHRARMKLLVELLGPATEVLVLGVGTGRELPALLDAGHRTTGLDCSQAMLRKCADRSRHGTLVHGDFWHGLPFEAGAFGAAVALHGTVAHPPSREAPARLVAELARVVRTEGVVVLELPTLAWFERYAGANAAGPGELHVAGGATTFVDRRSGARIDGCLVAPEVWVDAFAPTFACTLHLPSQDEATLVARRQACP
jgi:SAM-dependent methyltransferase